MIARASSPVSSVSKLAAEACEAEGVSLYWLLKHRQHRGMHDGRVVTQVFQRVVWRMRQARPLAPSFPEIAVALGRPNHSSIITAHQREQKRRDTERHYELVELGKAVAAGLVWHDQEGATT